MAAFYPLLRCYSRLDRPLSAPLFEVLAYEDTPLGPLCLRRRMTLSEPRQLVTEITLNHEFLMSSLHTDSERALADLSLAQIPGDGLRVLVGGLGLGYTAHAALASPRVAQVVVVEFLPQVIQWLREGLVPLADELNAETRLSVVQGDVYARLLSAPTDGPFDVILIDVDHSPEDQLDPSSAAFYSSDKRKRIRSSRHQLERRSCVSLYFRSTQSALRCPLPVACSGCRSPAETTHAVTGESSAAEPDSSRSGSSGSLQSGSRQC